MTDDPNPSSSKRGLPGGGTEDEAKDVTPEQIAAIQRKARGIGAAAPQMAEFAGTINEYTAGTLRQQKRFYQPYYSAFNLLGPALKTGGQTPLHQFPCRTGLQWFSYGVGQGPGQGFDRELRWSETNHDTTGGQIAQGRAIAAQSVGIVYDRTVPIAVRHVLDRFMIVNNDKYMNTWRMGAAKFWPESRFGLQSKAAATSIANTELEWAQNGCAASRVFPVGAELVFKGNDQLKFVGEVEEDFFCTSDGLPWNGGYVHDPENPGNGLDPTFGCLVYLVMEVALFEQSAA